MSPNRYTEEFRIEAVRQKLNELIVLEKWQAVLVSQHTSFMPRKRDTALILRSIKAKAAEQAEIRGNLRKELKRVTEERDILKKPRRTLPASPSKVRLY